MKITVISAYQTSAADFFTQIQEAQGTAVIDVRRHNSNQLAGFTKGKDLAYFVPALTGAKYFHDLHFVPSETLLKAYSAKTIGFGEYSAKYRSEMEKAKIKDYFYQAYGGFSSVVIIGAATKQRHSHAETLKSILEDK